MYTCFNSQLFLHMSFTDSSKSWKFLTIGFLALRLVQTSRIWLRICSSLCLFINADCCRFVNVFRQKFLKLAFAIRPRNKVKHFELEIKKSVPNLWCFYTIVLILRLIEENFAHCYLNLSQCLYCGISNVHHPCGFVYICMLRCEKLEKFPMVRFCSDLRFFEKNRNLWCNQLQIRSQMRLVWTSLNLDLCNSRCNLLLVCIREMEYIE